MLLLSRNGWQLCRYVGTLEPTVASPQVIIVENTKTSYKIGFKTDNATISSSLTLDDLVYTMTQEMHWIRIREQDPSTKFWSMCEVRTFASQNGSRTSICVDWINTGAIFSAPKYNMWHVSNQKKSSSFKIEKAHHIGCAFFFNDKIKLDLLFEKIV